MNILAEASKDTFIFGVLYLGGHEKLVLKTVLLAPFFAVVRPVVA